MAVSSPVVQAAAAVHFRNGTEVTEFFSAAAQTDFITWFNAHCANKEAWAGKSIGLSEQVKFRFRQIWDNIPVMFDSDSASLLQFAALMSVVINEAGQQLLPVTEICGTAACPGLAYPFNAIPGVKRSYNAAPANRLAGELFFHDEQFWMAHSHRAGADLIKGMAGTKQLWNGTVYPRYLFPTSLDPALSGFIQQADFFKFRGRGLIQVTWRANYRPIVAFVQGYAGENAVVEQYRDRWASLSPDWACTISSNEDWDALFQRTDFIVAARAIALHNGACGNYLRLSSDSAILSAASAVEGSLYNMGHRISGGSAYAALFSRRVAQMLNTLNHT